MTEESPSRPLITADDVRRWVDERDQLTTEYGQILNRLKAVQQKLDALAQLLPEDVVGALIGHARPTFDAPNGAGAAQPARQELPRAYRTRDRIPITDAVEGLLSKEAGGRPPAWLRDRLSEDSSFTDRLERSPASVSNALLRLVQRGKVIREDGLYYHPDMLAKIRSGEIVEERVENKASESFNSVMHSIMRERGGRFTAADAIAAAKQSNALRRKIEEQPSRVYSWLSREVFKKKLQKTDEFYSYPSNGEEAPNGNPSSASFAREGATSLFDDQREHTLR